MLEVVLEQLWLVGAPLALAVVNGLKGKYGFAAVGSVLALLGFWLGALVPFAGVLVLAGAIRVGKPDSVWARSYDKRRLLESMRRFPARAGRDDPDWVETIESDPDRPRVQDPAQWPSEHPALWDKTTRKAYLKQYGRWPS